MKMFRYMFMSLSSMEAIYKVMIKRLLFTLGFAFNCLMGAYFWYRGRSLELVFPQHDDLNTLVLRTVLSVVIFNFRRSDMEMVEVGMGLGDRCIKGRKSWRRPNICLFIKGFAVLIRTKQAMLCENLKASKKFFFQGI